MFCMQSTTRIVALTMILLVTGSAVALQFGPGQQGPNWDRGQNYTNPTGGSDFTPTVPNVGSTPTGTENAQSFYNAPERNNGSVAIRIRVPANAKITFDDTPTVQTGTERYYYSPPLEPGRSFVYRVRAQWDENGKPVDQTRMVSVRAGDQVNLNFDTTNNAGSSSQNQAR